MPPIILLISIFYDNFRFTSFISHPVHSWLCFLFSCFRIHSFEFLLSFLSMCMYDEQNVHRIAHCSFSVFFLVYLRIRFLTIRCVLLTGPIFDRDMIKGDWWRYTEEAENKGSSNSFLFFFVFSLSISLSLSQLY